MAIQNRRGAKKDFDATKMLPGEIAVTTDGTREVYAVFAPGDAKKLASEEEVQVIVDEFNEDVEENIQKATDEIEQKKEEALAEIPNYEARLAELEAYKANSILSKASGEVVTTTDSAKVKPKNIKLFGKGKQRQYEGNQLLNIPINWNNGNVSIVGDGATFRVISASCDVEYSNLKVFDDLFCFEAGETYSINRKETYMHLGFWFYDSEGNIAETLTTEGTNNKTKTIPNDVVRVTMYFAGLTTGSSYDFEQNFMVNKGEPKDWEPFVGNEPSPSINYPQKAEFLGESGSIGGKVLTGNLFNKTTRHLYIDTISDNGLTFTTTSHTNSTYTNVAMLYLDAIPMKVGRQYYVALDIKLVSGSTGGINMMRLWDCNNKDVGSQISITRPQVNSSYQHYITKVDIIESDTNACCIYIQGFNTENAVFEITNVMISAITPDYEPYTEQPFTFQTPNGLRGIPLGQTIPDAIKNSPIHMSGVYWDGEQYQIADTENENGKDVQRIDVLDNNSWELSNKLSSTSGYRFINKLNMLVQSFIPIVSTHFQFERKYSFSQEGTYITTDEATNAIYLRVEESTTPFTTTEDIVAWMNENDVKTYYILAEPIITESTDQYDVVMNYPNTTIVNDAGAYMEVEYVCDTKEHIKQNYVSKEAHEEHESRIAELEKAMVNS